MERKFYLEEYLFVSLQKTLFENYTRRRERMLVISHQMDTISSCCVVQSCKSFFPTLLWLGCIAQRLLGFVITFMEEIRPCIMYSPSYSINQIYRTYTNMAENKSEKIYQ